MEDELKRKSSNPRDQDRLSELPDSLIFNIFEFLPMKDIVRTQILSHRWKNLWTLTPFLYFQNDGDNVELGNFVNRVLSSWRGTRVHKFKLSDIAFDEPTLCIDMDSWLHFAVDNGVEELDITFKGFRNSETNIYCFPQFLYSCSSLKNLSYSGCIIEVIGKSVQWNQLLSLTIQGYFQVTSSVVKKILRGSPRLEVFNLYIEDSDVNKKLNFQSSSLKVLLISKIFNGHSIADIPKDTELRIWAPNLKSLRIEGMPYGKCLLKNVPSLSHVTLWFDSDFDDSVDSDDFCANDLEGTLSQILPAIQHVEGLTLSDWSIKVLLIMNCKSLLSPFPNVKFISLNGKFEEIEWILGLVEIFPKTETLVVKEDKDFYVESNAEFKWNPSMYFLDELRTVEVTWNQRDFSIFPLIESLLHYARKLERMVFRVKETKRPSSPTTSLYRASKKLCRMPRSSPIAELVICENYSSFGSK